MEPRVLTVISKMQSVLEGEANTDIMTASSYIIANAVAILAQDRAHADRMIKQCRKDQQKMLDGLWDKVRTELERRKLLSKSQ